MDDLTLASRVRANLAVAAGTSNLEVEVSARGGSVTIAGKLSATDQLADLQTIAGRTPGVVDLIVNVSTEH